MKPRLKLSKASTATPVDATEYQSLVGCLRYLVHTRSDIAFAIGYVSRFMENPTTEHLNAVKRILRYIVGTIDYGCYYKHGGKELKLHGYSDADMGGDIDTRKSTTGVLFFLGSCPVTWQSQKHKVSRVIVLRSGVHCRDDSGLSRYMAGAVACRAEERAAHSFPAKDG